jgi:hypothetical protein
MSPDECYLCGGRAQIVRTKDPRGVFNVLCESCPPYAITRGAIAAFKRSSSRRAVWRDRLHTIAEEHPDSLPLLRRAKDPDELYFEFGPDE